MLLSSRVLVVKHGVLNGRGERRVGVGGGRKPVYVLLAIHCGEREETGVARKRNGVYLLVATACLRGGRGGGYVFAHG